MKYVIKNAIHEWRSVGDQHAVIAGRDIYPPTAVEIFHYAFIEALLWSESDDEGDPLRDSYCADDIAAMVELGMLRQCQDFYTKAAKFIPEDRIADAGHDFCLTRNNHGAGFWDGDWPEHGGELTALAHEFPPLEIYIGDDGLIYAMGMERGWV